MDSDLGSRLGQGKEIENVTSGTAVQIRAALSRTKAEALKRKQPEVPSVVGPESVEYVSGSSLNFKESLNSPDDNYQTNKKSKKGVRQFLPDTTLVKKNEGVAKRAQLDEKQHLSEHPTNESSWVALQRKAELYNKIRSGEVEEDHVGESLVDFVRKNHYDPVSKLFLQLV
ncbi:hypothetical protein HK096_005384 [Nowakowskiella sp. JEL0078]|nr:hypothetical protein HK096_005384 [Nowakowskiella sp. JEL0078]